jgi:hypothetical protein
MCRVLRISAAHAFECPQSRRRGESRTVRASHRYAAHVPSRSQLQSPPRPMQQNAQRAQAVACRGRESPDRSPSRSVPAATQPNQPITAEVARPQLCRGDVRRSNFKRRTGHSVRRSSRIRRNVSTNLRRSVRRTDAYANTSWRASLVGVRLDSTIDGRTAKQPTSAESTGVHP